MGSEAGIPLLTANREEKEVPMYPQEQAIDSQKWSQTNREPGTPAAPAPAPRRDAGSSGSGSASKKTPNAPRRKAS